ncbi:unnamed protein product [Callosobruchus maculatus]|uniref:Uncharacterized protein n=1 Tax=Callosobruchus maculatus TaxID=64391 RepID=A0A653C004_CALMS|nr:unnamed protein product [Callosobruchus maculatus]
MRTSTLAFLGCLAFVYVQVAESGVVDGSLAASAAQAKALATTSNSRKDLLTESASLSAAEATSASSSSICCHLWSRVIGIDL